MVIQFISMILMTLVSMYQMIESIHYQEVSITITHHEVITLGDVLIFKDIQELDITMNDLMKPVTNVVVKLYKPLEDGLQPLGCRINEMTRESYIDRILVYNTTKPEDNQTFLHLTLKLI